MRNELSSILDGFVIEDAEPKHPASVGVQRLPATQPNLRLVPDARPKATCLEPSSSGQEVEWFSNLLERAAQYGYRAS